MNFLRSSLWILVVLGFLVGVARYTSLRWWRVPDDDPDLATSVAPTLRPGDWVILWRLTAPGVGDLVLCPDPEDPAEVVIGRIAAGGGDKILIKENGDLERNDQKARSERACNQATFVVDHPRSGDEVELRCDIETLAGVHHQRAIRPSAGLKPMPVQTEVDTGEVFLVSDNRFLPFDSRDFGALPEEACAETIVFRLVSRLGFGHVSSRLSWIQ